MDTPSSIDRPSVPSSYNFVEGELLLLDKPLDWTSFDVVNKIRGTISRSIGRKLKVGHAGTLDPRATGLLLICTGKKTKTIDALQGMDKVYTATFHLGATTPTFDTESEIDKTFPTEHINEDLILETAKLFEGIQIQRPPAHSAVKIKGKRAYELARKGEEVKTKERQIEVLSFKVLSVEMPYVSVEIHCSKGTYIRSLASDFGLKIGSGAYLKELRRTKIGDYSVADAIEVQAFQQMISPSE